VFDLDHAIDVETQAYREAHESIRLYKPRARTLPKRPQLETRELAAAAQDLRRHAAVVGTSVLSLCDRALGTLEARIERMQMPQIRTHCVALPRRELLARMRDVDVPHVVLPPGDTERQDVPASSTVPIQYEDTSASVRIRVAAPPRYVSDRSIVVSNVPADTARPTAGPADVWVEALRIVALRLTKGAR